MPGLRPTSHGEIHDHHRYGSILAREPYAPTRLSWDSALTVGGSSYNGSISVKDANNSVKVTLDRNGITAVSGKIGGLDFRNKAP